MLEDQPIFKWEASTVPKKQVRLTILGFIQKR